MGGLRLALTLFTVAPLGIGRVDRGTARSAMALAPLVGGALGILLGLLGWGARAVGATPLLAAAIVISLSVLLTRALHVDGLADTADALGSYARPERALEIMRKSDIGPFGVAAIGLVLLIDTAAATALLAGLGPAYGAVAGVGTAPGAGPGATDLGLLGSLGDGLHGVAAFATAFAAGRLGATVACRAGLPAARPDGLGALVAGTVGWPLLAVAVLATAAFSTLADPVRGPIVVVGAVAVAWGLTAHARRRIGGVTGDVMGATIELSTLTALVVLALR